MKRNWLFPSLWKVKKSQRGIRIEVDDFQLWAESYGINFMFLKVRSNVSQYFHTSEVIQLKMK